VNRSRSALFAAMALTLSGLLLLGCGGAGNTTTTTESDAVADSPRVAVVKTRTMADPTTVVVDSEGMTVYEFRRDDPMLYRFDQAPVPTCYRECSVIWVPLLTDDPPKATGGADADMLGTVRRKDGGVQVTYAGHPLYLYAGDRQPGQMNGQDADSFGARWHAVEGDGQALLVAAR
jgi:predicted lipoprotein with Yx(FWY)xxD motif